MNDQPDSHVTASGSDQSIAGGARSRRGRRRLKETSWAEILTPTRWVKIAIISVLIVVLYRHEVQRMFHVWSTDGNWSHGFLIPLFSLYFLHQRRERLARVDVGPNWLGLVLLVLTIVGYMYSIYPLKMGYPKLLMFLGTIFAAVLLCCGWRVIKITWLPILFLFFALPLPRRLYVQLTMPMRVWSSKVAAVILDVIPGIELEVTGVLIDGAYYGEPFTLNVAEACAGMRLMMAFLALGVAMAYLSERPNWHRIVLVLSTLPIAILCNFLRVSLTGILFILVDPMFAEGGFHTALGLVMLPVAFLFYWIIAEVLGKLYIDVPVEDGA